MSQTAELNIKGTAFLTARRDLLALVESGRFSRVALERRLQPRDLELLAETPLPTNWYPLATYDRMLRVLMDIEGNGDKRYLIQRARKAMAALMQSGIYRQLERAQVVVREGHGWFERSGHILATLPTAFFDKGSWKLSADEAKRNFTLEGSGLVGLTENVAHIIQGALEYVAEQLTESPSRVTLQRVRDGRVVFLGNYGDGLRVVK
jgi:hypothetical protein